MIENLREFVVEPGPEDYLVHCRITRNNRGIDHGRIHFYPLIPLAVEIQTQQISDS